jgi:serine/threonine protein phosphatase PrpC
VCSDGVWEALPIDEIEKSLSVDDALTACSELQKKLFAAECGDNVSFVFI